jgi:ubiquinone/menaquinone biosynthesis C-methylase UbiE
MADSDEARDRWAEWLRLRRHGGDDALQRQMVAGLSRVRDRVLDNAQVQPGETLLDVGCGDGLIAFGALDRLGAQGRVIFSDISRELLDVCAELARAMGVFGRCACVRAAADDLGPIADASVDVITTRSVLIFVEDKRRALREFYRVLRPGGRLSIFEPINRFMFPEPPGRFFGYDVSPVQDLALRVLASYARLSRGGATTMLDFDDRDLIAYAEEAGFPEAHAETTLEIVPKGGLASGPLHPPTWESFLRSSPNPLAPTLEEAMADALAPEEAQRFIATLRPLVEANHGTDRMATTFLWAVKGEA